MNYQKIKMRYEAACEAFHQKWSSMEMDLDATKEKFKAAEAAGGGEHHGLLALMNAKLDEIHALKCPDLPREMARVPETSTTHLQWVKAIGASTAAWHNYLAEVAQ